MRILVGSTALQHHLPNSRTPNDVDVWSDEQYDKQQGYDYKVMPSSILQLLEYVRLDDTNVATLDSLYTIKCSHLGWDSPNWHKHKLDLLHMRHLGCVLNQQLYTALLQIWKTKLGTKDFLSLNKSKQDFFTDNVTYVYDHDWLHQQVSYPQVPVYTHCLVDGADVLIDKQKFDLLPFKQQVCMFREEITVIAIERWLVHPNNKVSWVQAYMKALKKTITTLTKGWATEFLVMNLQHFIKPEYCYFKYTLNKIKDNK